MNRVRAVFISDVHLGTRACQAERLLEFLRAYSAEQLYLVGDIVDFWAMKREVRWTPAQNTVVQKILRRARNGERVTFIPGNHDEALREHVGITLGDIRVERECVHTTAAGKRYLVLHGDEFDQVTRYHRWLAVLGDRGYELLVRINGWLSWLRRRLGMAGYWSLAGYAKRKIKTAVSFVTDFETSVARAVRERGLDGVICGHIHVAALRDVDGIAYVNCGDWVDSCTAIVEHHDGRLELIEWGGETGTSILTIEVSVSATLAVLARDPAADAPARAVRELNRERSRYGVPAGEDPAATRPCGTIEVAPE